MCTFNRYNDEKMDFTGILSLAGIIHILVQETRFKRGEGFNER